MGKRIGGHQKEVSLCKLGSFYHESSNYRLRPHGQVWFEINERVGCATSFKKIPTNATMKLTKDSV